MSKTRISSKGQVVIPKDVRDRHGWKEGTELEVEDGAASITLRAAAPFPRTTIDQVAGCLKYRGRPLTLEEMDEAVAREARKRR
jgi:AbrB family looped-hinge helix DNA binding protein